MTDTKTGCKAPRFVLNYQFCFNYQYLKQEFTLEFLDILSYLFIFGYLKYEHAIGSIFAFAVVLTLGVIFPECVISNTNLFGLAQLLAA